MKWTYLPWPIFMQYQAYTTYFHDSCPVWLAFKIEAQWGQQRLLESTGIDEHTVTAELRGIKKLDTNLSYSTDRTHMLSTR